MGTPDRNTRTTSTLSLPRGEPATRPDGTSALLITGHGPQNTHTDSLGLGPVAQNTGGDDLTLPANLALAVQSLIVADPTPIPALVLTPPFTPTDSEDRALVLKVARGRALRTEIGLRTRKTNAGGLGHSHHPIRILIHGLNAIAIKKRNIGPTKRKSVGGERERRKKRRNRQPGAPAHIGENMVLSRRQTFITKPRNSEPGFSRSENSIQKFSPRIRSAKSSKCL